MRVSTTIIALVAVISVLLACSCSRSGNTEGSLDTSKAEAQLVSGNTGFGLELYSRLRAREGNLFLSPYSISSALAMTYGGARGSTASQMEEVLEFPVKGETLHAAFGSLTRSLNAKGEGGQFELSVANALWGQQDYPFLDSFLEMNRKHYDAGINLVDFKEDPDGVRLTINRWVEEKTRDKIKDLIKPGVLTALTRLVLTNAIYFKGKWASEFEEGRTTEQPFWLSSDESVDVPMMEQSNDYGYMETDSLQVLELPYRGDAISMVVLLPREKEGLADLEQSLTADRLAGWLGQLRVREVIVSLPRFKMTVEFSLGDVLKAMGMTEAFVYQKADLSGMDGSRELFISSVIHKAFVDVNEEGTEAAAATAVEIETISIKPPPPVFRADHPFIFIIRDNESGSILFIGRLVDP